MTPDLAFLAMVSMAALLGAALLAIALLYLGWRAHRSAIADLSAQLAAHQIAALAGGASPPAPTSPPEPTRRRRHLSLHAGGAAVAAVTCRDSILNLLSVRPGAMTDGASLTPPAAVGGTVGEPVVVGQTVRAEGRSMWVAPGRRQGPAGHPGVSGWPTTVTTPTREPHPSGALPPARLRVTGRQPTPRVRTWKIRDLQQRSRT